MTKRLEYILSGTSYTRVHAAMEQPEMVSMFNDIFSVVGRDTNHKFGLLYNAFTEPGFGKNLRQFPCLDSIHADSGGLQIITQGLSATKEIKDNIYKNQATYADLGMCFDEIPIKTSGTTSGRNDTSNRFFDMDGLEQAARETGGNIARQIEVFLEEKSTCKPILIAQGNCYDTYMRWVDYILQEIPQDMQQYIGGVAMGGAALGTGSLEDIERAFIYTQLPLEKKHLHVLGVGSVKRLLPYLVFMKNGSYEGASVSYDSTTHSSGVELGNYFTDGSMQSFNRSFSTVYETMFAESAAIREHGVDPKEFHRCLNTGKTAYLATGGNAETFYSIRLSVIIGSVLNFCKTVDKLLESDKEFAKVVASDHSLAPLNALFDVTTVNAYNRWKGHVGRYVKTNRIGSSQPMTLGNLVPDVQHATKVLEKPKAKRTVTPPLDL